MLAESLAMADNGKKVGFYRPTIRPFKGAAMTIGHEIIGQGSERVIALHTWLADHSTYKPMFPYLDRDTFSYAFVDYRGYGKSKELVGEFTIKEIANDVCELADELQWNAFHLIGNSMGGHVAQYLAGTQSMRVKSAALLNPVPVSGAPLKGDTLALCSSAAENPDSRGTIMHIATGERLSDGWRRAMVEMSVSTSTTDAIHKYLDAWTNTNLVGEVEGAKTPLRIILGTRDPIITEDGMKQSVVQWFENSEIHKIESAGHFPSVEAPCDVVALCESFFGSKK
jgi:pimeloyl-ACP methyl ester carboxylesterase